MKIKVNQNDFTKALTLASKSLSSKVNLPVLANLLLIVGKNELEVVATNLETATTVKVGCEVEVEGRITVPGRQLIEFVSQLPPKEVVVEKLGEEVVVATDGYKARLATIPAEDFPAIPKTEGAIIKVPSGDFVKAVERIAFCAAQDEGRPVLTGVLVAVGGDFLSLVATDGYRLAYQKIGGSFGAEPVKFLVPAKALLEAAKIISESRGEKLEEEDRELEIMVGKNLNQVNFKVGNVEFTSRLIEGEFPNWQKIIPASFKSAAKVNREDFARLVRVASIFARDAGNIVRLELSKGDKGSKGALKVLANNSQVGSNEAQEEIELTGTGGEIAFNFRYLLEVLASFSAEEVNFEMIESLNPGRITVPGEPDYFHIIMPVRLQS